MGWGGKAISAELGAARNTVRRYLRGPPAGSVERAGARKLDEAQRKKAEDRFKVAAAGNAVVGRDLLPAEGVGMGVRTVQRAAEGFRRSVRAPMKLRRSGTRLSRGRRCRSTSARRWSVLGA